MMRQWVATWNEDPKPFVWHKTAEQILEVVGGEEDRDPEIV
jgi:hypothetical protein